MSNVRNHCFCGACPKCQKTAIRRERNALRAGCRCGHPGCDCARWEQIWREKFEDPTYYQQSFIRSAGSSLGDVIAMDLQGVSRTGRAGVVPDRWRTAMRGMAATSIAIREQKKAA